MTKFKNLEETGKITIRSVYKIPEAHLEPVPDPVTGRWPDYVIPVEDGGVLTLTEKQRDAQEAGKVKYIGTNEKITIKDGTTFDLDDISDKAWWDAIKHSKLIARARYARDENNNLIVDGNTKRYGVAAFYVEVPGKDSEIKVSKRKKINQAESFIFKATRDEIYQKARLLGQNMNTFSEGEVQEYLLNIAAKDPNKIIELFTGEDIALRILFLDALENRVIVFAGNRVYQFANTILGSTQESALAFLKLPENSKVLGLLRRETYPQQYAATTTEAPVSTDVELKAGSTSRATKK